MELQNQQENLEKVTFGIFVIYRYAVIQKIRRTSTKFITYRSEILIEQVIQMH
jgi:hypothetical protein